MNKLSPAFSEQLDYYLDKAIRFDAADMGNIQLFNPESQTLEIVAQKGFRTDFLEYFKTVKAFDSSACGRAIALGSPIMIGNIMQDIAFIPHRTIAASAGFRAVKSVPILSKNQTPLGIISTHYKLLKWNWDLNAISDVVKNLSRLLELQVKVG